MTKRFKGGGSKIDPRLKPRLLGIMVESMRQDFSEMEAGWAETDDEESVLSRRENELFKEFVIRTRASWLAKLSADDLAKAVLTDGNADLFFLA